MKKNNNKDNILIKRKNLLILAKTHGLRLSRESFKDIEMFIKEFIEKILRIAKEEATIKGRKTISREDVNEAFDKINQRKEKINWEV